MDQEIGSFELVLLQVSPGQVADGRVRLPVSHFNARKQTALEIPCTGACFQRIVLEVDYRGNAVAAGKVVIEGGKFRDATSKCGLSDSAIEVEELGPVFLGEFDGARQPVAGPSLAYERPFVISKEARVVQPGMGGSVERGVFRIVHIRAYVTETIGFQEGFEGGDRTSLDLPREEEELLRALHGTGKPLIVVLMNGSALSVNWEKENANAIVGAWYPGEEGGAAIAQTLAGINNPSGRLPVTFYTGVEQLPAFEDYSMSNRTYRYFTGKPLYWFGYGLSYSKFEYSNLKLSSSHLQAGESLHINVDVKNASQREGDEVVELYLTFPKLGGAPIRALRGFTRVHLGAGEVEHVRMELDARDLSHVNESGDRIIAPGSYTLSIGGGEPGTGAPVVEAVFTITGQAQLPE